MNRITSLWELISDYTKWNGLVQRWRLASAVSNAGGLGLFGAGSMHPDVLRDHIKMQTGHN